MFLKIQWTGLGKPAQGRLGSPVCTAGCTGSSGCTGSLRSGSHSACLPGTHLAGSDTRPHLEYRAVNLLGIQKHLWGRCDAFNTWFIWEPRGSQIVTFHNKRVEPLTYTLSCPAVVCKTFCAGLRRDHQEAQCGQTIIHFYWDSFLTVVKISEPSHTKYTRFFPSLHDFLTVITVSDCIKMGWQNNT